MARALDPSVTIRDDLRPGDLGWVIGKHGELYAAEYGWSREFEALVAGIATAFFTEHDAACERGWYAEWNGRRVGCIFLVRVDERVAKLRMLIVDPEARGLGVGRALVETCVAFARAAGYQSITLWTKSILTAARSLYIDIGFELAASNAVTEFGHATIDETWTLDLHRVRDAG